MDGPEDGVEESAAKMWRDERWLQSNELNENSVLDYFALSDWYTDAISLPPFPSSPPLPLTSWLKAIYSPRLLQVHTRSIVFNTFQSMRMLILHRLTPLTWPLLLPSPGHHVGKNPPLALLPH